MKIRCKNIEWDDETDDGIRSEGLPSEVTLDVDDEDYAWAKSENGDCVGDLVVDALSEKAGWLVKSYEFEELGEMENEK